MSSVVQTQPGVHVHIASRHCPYCKSVRVHVSRRQGLTDAIFSLAAPNIRRCHDCGHRQAWFEAKWLRQTGISLGKLHSIKHRFLGVALIGLTVFGCRMLFWSLRE